MNVSETLQILEALRLCGAKHFKCPELEITMEGNAVVTSGALPQAPVGGAPGPQMPQVMPNEDATKRAQDLINALKMKDTELLDKIFPAGAGG